MICFLLNIYFWLNVLKKKKKNYFCFFPDWKLTAVSLQILQWNCYTCCGNSASRCSGAGKRYYFSSSVFLYFLFFIFTFGLFSLIKSLRMKRVRLWEKLPKILTVKKKEKWNLWTVFQILMLNKKYYSIK